MFYSEKRTPLGTWSPQTTERRPPTVTACGAKITLRRERELRDDERGLSLDELKALADEIADHEFRLAEEARTEADGFVTVYAGGGA